MLVRSGGPYSGLSLSLQFFTEYLLPREYYHFSSTCFCCLPREYYYFSSTLLHESCHRKSEKGVHALPIAIPLHRKVCKKLKSTALPEQQSRTQSYLQSSY
jgi:hypothetical protein